MACKLAHHLATRFVMVLSILVLGYSAKRDVHSKTPCEGTSLRSGNLYAAIEDTLCGQGIAMQSYRDIYATITSQHDFVVFRFVCQCSGLMVDGLWFESQQWDTLLSPSCNDHGQVASQIFTLGYFGRPNPSNHCHSQTSLPVGVIFAVIM